jgi:hypothetical protein
MRAALKSEWGKLKIFGLSLSSPRQVVVVGPHSVRVESLLGEGGLATVYRASDVVGTTADPSAMVFALKHMRLANAEAVRDTADEARTLAKLRGHPHILKLVATAFAGPEGAETDGFMLLEYCPGTLLELLQVRAHVVVVPLPVFGSDPVSWPPLFILSGPAGAASAWTS